MSAPVQDGVAPGPPGSPMSLDAQETSDVEMESLAPDSSRDVERNTNLENEEMESVVEYGSGENTITPHINRNQAASTPVEAAGGNAEPIVPGHAHQHLNIATPPTRGHIQVSVNGAGEHRVVITVSGSPARLERET